MDRITDSRDIDSGSCHCPVSGLKIYCRPEWKNVSYGDGDYRLSTSVIGKNIILNEVSGHVTLDSSRKALVQVESVVSQLGDTAQGIVIIDDFIHVEDFTYDARTHYIEYAKSIDRVKALIVCISKPLIKLSARLAIMSTSPGFDTIVVTSYEDAVRLALEYNEGVEEEGLTHRHFPDFENSVGGSRESEICPVTGLGVTCLPEWREGEFGNMAASLSVIGGRIVHTSIHRCLVTDGSGMDAFYRKRLAVIRSAVKPGDTFVDIIDCTHLELGNSEALVKCLMEENRLHSGRIIEIIAFNAPESVKSLSFTVAKLYRFSYEITILEDGYGEAVKRAVSVLESREKPFRCGGLHFRGGDTGPEGCCTRRDTGWHGGGGIQMPACRHVDDLIDFLGNIDWRTEGLNEADAGLVQGGLFKSVYDAIRFIKLDMDQLFSEQRRTQAALEESETLIKALLNATGDSLGLLGMDGEILALNNTYANRFGKTVEEMKGANIQEYIGSDRMEYCMAMLDMALTTGRRARFEENNELRYVDNTIYPIYNPMGEVDKVAFYQRDITELKKAELQIHKLNQELIRLQEGERRKLAGELHENVAQELAALIINLGTLYDGSGEIPPAVLAKTDRFTRILKKSIVTIRTMAYGLGTATVEQLGLVQAVASYCSDFSKENNLKIDFYSAGLENIDRDFDTDINIYRLVQEALKNMKEHSQADTIVIRLLFSHPDIILRVGCNGRGTDLDEVRGNADCPLAMGIKGMEERVSLLSGELTIHSKKGRGTRMVVRIPCKSGNAACGSMGEDCDPVVCQ